MSEFNKLFLFLSYVKDKFKVVKVLCKSTGLTMIAVPEKTRNIYSKKTNNE